MTTEIELTEAQRSLLLAAERVFALQGIAGTTIRQINAAAGQKNSSAIHYHFGSRDAILDAIMALRVTPVNHQRAKMIRDALAATNGMPLSIETIIDMLMKPMIDRFLHTEGPHFTQRFILNLRMDMDAWRRYQRKHKAWTLDDLQRELRRARPYIPTQILRSRFRNVVNFSMFAMSEIEHAESRLGERYSREESIFRIEELTGELIAMIDAPVTAKTAQALHNLQESGRSAPPGILTD